MRRLCRFFTEGRTNVNDEQRSGNLPVFTDNLKEKLEFKYSGSQAFKYFCVTRKLLLFFVQP